MPIKITIIIALAVLLSACKGRVSSVDSPKQLTQPIALYLFNQAGPIAEDQSDRSAGVPLKVFDNKLNEISWVDGRAIKFIPQKYRVEKSGMDAKFKSELPAQAIVKEIKQSNEFSVELWFKPDNVEQTGPVRIFSISQNNGRRNLTVGHSASAYDFRIRTTDVNLNGLPSLRTKSSFIAKAELNHVILNYDKSGAHIYINGESVPWFFYEGKAPGPQLSGSLANWDESYKIILGDEHTGDRAWKGEIYKVAIYNRKLPVNEILHKYKIGLNF